MRAAGSRRGWTRSSAASAQNRGTPVFQTSLLVTVGGWVWWRTSAAARHGDARCDAARAQARLPRPRLTRLSRLTAPSDAACFAALLLLGMLTTWSRAEQPSAAPDPWWAFGSTSQSSPNEGLPQPARASALLRFLRSPRRSLRHPFALFSVASLFRCNDTPSMIDEAALATAQLLLKEGDAHKAERHFTLLVRARCACAFLWTVRGPSFGAHSACSAQCEAAAGSDDVRPLMGLAAALLAVRSGPSGLRSLRPFEFLEPDRWPSPLLPRRSV